MRRIRLVRLKDEAYAVYSVLHNAGEWLVGHVDTDKIEVVLDQPYTFTR